MVNPKKKPARLCSSCGYRHPTPTGKNCMFTNVEVLEDNRHDEASDEMSSSDDGGIKEKVPPAKDSKDAFEKKFNARLDRLENIMLQSLDKKPKSNISAYDTTDSSFSEDTQDWEVYRRKKHRNMDVTTLVHHLKFLATKAVKATYKPEAFILYDKAVRQRAAKTGLAAFGQVSQEEVVLQFCPENMVYKAKPGKKSDAPQSKKKTNSYCKHFNDDDCHFKGCVYAHRCMACDDVNHGRKSCPSMEKSK